MQRQNCSVKLFKEHFKVQICKGRLLEKNEITFFRISPIDLPGHVFKSGPAEVRANAEGRSGGEHGRGYSPSRKGGSGGSPPRKFLIYGCLYVRFLCILDAF